MARILVIDDEESNRFTVREILELAGHDVEEAANGIEGIALQKANPFDLVITDIIMPQKEGIETIIELMESFPKIKIIAISGSGPTRKSDFLNTAHRLGACRTIQKPFGEDILLQAVADCLASI